MAKRKGHGEGSVWRLKNGSWRGQIMDGYTADGKKNIISFSAPTKAEVLDKIREYKNQCDQDIHVDKAMTFSAWADIWYADYKSQVTASTYSSYKYTLNILKERFGNRPISEIMVIHINAFMDLLAGKGYSMSQIKKCRTMLIQIFDAADANGLVPRNPARKAKIIRDKDGSLSHHRDKDAFTEEEIELLCKNLKEDILGHSIRLMLGTGLRVQELLALSAEDISADGATVMVRHAIKMVDGIPTLGDPKSESGNRTIPVPERYRESARFLREHGNQPLIWSCQGDHPYYSVGSFRRRFYTALKEVGGVRLLSPHCCRHTYVTQLQAKGVPLETIAALVGHSSIDTTMGYTHISMDTLMGAVSSLN